MNNSHQVVETTAEDELVAIILSALVGNIIESWQLIASDDDDDTTGMSQDYQSLSRSEESVVDDNANLPLEISENSFDLNLSKSGIRTHFSKLTLNKSEHPSYFSKLSIDPDKHSLQIEKSSSSKLPTTEGEQQKVQIDQVLRSLFEENQEITSHWEFLDSNILVSILFKQGNKYEGSLSRCRMHGRGKFSWSDGSVYTGKFVNGEMTGEGCLQWPDQSWYEGELMQGLRNGLGLFVQRPTFYAGTWKCGSRQGPGTIYYMERDTNVDYYNGEWCKDMKEGTGLRCYKSGAMYSGEWRQGMRDGLGTMVWTNSDVYSGYWNKGELHGYGEYTWDTFFNQQLVVPQENCYYGEWNRGFRHGNGTLETSQGAIIRGTWNNGKKDGPAEVICCNGNLIYAENLFFEDNIFFKQENLSETDSLMDTTAHTTELFRVPVTTVSHDIDLTYYIKRLNKYINNTSKKEKIFFKAISLSDIQSTSEKSYSGDFAINKTSGTVNLESCRVESDSEEYLLRNIIQQYLSMLRMLYTNYSEVCCQSKPTFSSVLMRFMLWQLLRDCNLNNRGLSLADCDKLIANNKATLVQSAHYPFERLYFWQFLHCIIELSWELYGKYCCGTSNVPGMLASAFHKLITLDILPNAGKYKGNALFKYKNLMSLDSVYWLYKSIGEPFSARKLLKEITISKPANEENDYPTVKCEIFQHQIHGKNVIGVGGKLTYHLTNYPVLPKMKEPIECEQPMDLTRLRSIGLLAVFDSIKEICPSIHRNNTIVDMDYEIVFLEFYEIILLCAQLYVQMKMKNEEKQETVEQSNLNESFHTQTSVQQDKEIPTQRTESKGDKSKRTSTTKKKKQKK